ncbi:MAG: hypothetical protein QOD60_613 [Solirubrobacterales bacterium]|nr:hypothetical protein [Solirubrobacterales bacterium]
MKRLGTALAAGAIAVALTAVPAHAAQTKFFQTADKNIACVVFKGFKSKRRHGHKIKGVSGIARCDILNKSWTVPPPARKCLADYGNGLEVFNNGLGHPTCAGDSVFSPNNPVLAAGASIVQGRFTCTALAAGMRCTNTRNSHGFELTPATYSLF